MQRASVRWSDDQRPPPATATERALMDRACFRLETIEERQRISRTGIYLFAGGLLAIVSFVTTALIAG